LLPTFPFLRLDSKTNREAVLLVRAVDESTQDGTRRLSRDDTHALIERALWRDIDMAEVRRFVEAVGLGGDLPGTCDGEIRDLLSSAIERSELVAVSSGAVGSAVGPVASEGLRLVDEIARALGGREFRLGAEIYSVALGANVARSRDRQSFVVLTRREAIEVLSAAQPGVPVRLRALLDRARALLGPGGASLEYDGVVLIRRAKRAVPPPPAEVPSVTPSQVRTLIQKTWIEIDVAFDDGTPYAGSVQVTLPDGRVTNATTNAKGVLRLDGIAPGQCKVSFPAVDAAWGQVAEDS
jgi:hypothetical protein